MFYVAKMKNGTCARLLFEHSFRNVENLALLNVRQETYALAKLHTKHGYLDYDFYAVPCIT